MSDLLPHDVLLNKAATIERLGVPQSARDVFSLIVRAGWIELGLADSLERVVGFRNIAVHDDQSLQLPLTISVITRHLNDFLHYSEAILRREAQGA